MCVISTACRLIKTDPSGYVSHVSPGKTRTKKSAAEALGTLASVAGNFVRGVQQESAAVEVILNVSGIYAYLANPISSNQKHISNSY